MRRVLLSVLLVVFLTSLVIVAFTVRQSGQEEASLTSDLQYRSSLLTISLRDSIEPYVVNKSNTTYLTNLVEKLTDKERLVGVAVYDNKENMLAASSTLPKDMTSAKPIISQVMDGDRAGGTFAKVSGKKMYFFALPLHDKDSISGALLVVQNADYIDQRIYGIWKNNLIRLLLQASLLAVAIVLIIRWIIYEPMKQIVEFLKTAQAGNADEKKLNMSQFHYFSPLIKEVSHLSRNLTEARLTASEEARLRLEKIDSPWTAQRLQEFVKATLKDRSIFVVSNREPYIHIREGNQVTIMEPASGIVTAIEPIMRACGGTWIAHGSGTADKEVVDKDDHIAVPPDDPKYTLSRVWLTPEEEKGYYYGFANEGLWPLCHIVHTRPIFRKEDWVQYEKVNGKFAQVILNEIKDVQKPIILIQDYHFALLPRMINKGRPDTLVGIFWHIPWPNSESFSICPWRKELLDGILGADLIGFHTQFHCNNFIETVGRELESLIDWEQFVVTRHGHPSYIKTFPISIPFVNGRKNEISIGEAAKEKEEILRKINVKSKYVGLGVDRMDYTKGLIERFKAIELFLEKYPSYVGEFTFIQIAAPSRSIIETYRQFTIDVEAEVNRINDKFKKKDWKPIVLLKKHHSHSEIQKYYRLADVCLVTSLHDGMNLVAKEFVSARDDEQGVLILSQFAGASRELKESLIVNPYNTEQTSEALFTALTLSPSEQKKKMSKMREMIRNYNVYRWSAELLKTLVNIK